MAGNGINNGGAFMGANRQSPLTPVQREIIRRYLQHSLANYGRHPNPQPGDTPGERPEPEDTTGLKLLEEFLRRRGDKLNQERSARDGNERK